MNIILSVVQRLLKGMTTLVSYTGYFDDLPEKARKIGNFTQVHKQDTRPGSPPVQVLSYSGSGILRSIYTIHTPVSGGHYPKITIIVDSVTYTITYSTLSGWVAWGGTSTGPMIQGSFTDLNIHFKDSLEVWHEIQSVAYPDNILDTYVTYETDA